MEKSVKVALKHISEVDGQRDGKRDFKVEKKILLNLQEVI